MHCSFIGSYIVSISDLPIFHITDLDFIWQQLCSQDNIPPCSVNLVIAPEQCSSFDDCPSPTPLCLHDLCHIAALQLTTGEGLLTAEFTTAISEQQELYSTDQMSFLVH